MAVRPTSGGRGKELAMKWLLVAGALALVSSLGCCGQGGLFNQQPNYGSYYPAATYATPAANYTTTNPCTCN